jgi:membrane protein
MAAMDLVKQLIARALKLRVVRAFQHYALKRGPILSSGMAYSALFSVFAGIAALFSIAGAVLADDIVLRTRLIDAVAGVIPGLISQNGSEGAIDPDDLLSSSVAFNVTGVIALVGLLFTALGFLASARDAVREVFDLPPAPGNFLFMKLTDLVFLIGFLVLIVISTTLSVVGTGATSFVLDLIGIGSDSLVGAIVGRLVSLVLVVALDAVAVAGILRILARIRIPFRELAQGALLGGVGIAVLTVLFQLGILGGASSNPLLASFVVILGLLIFFNFICQALLISAAWTATVLGDKDIPVVAKTPNRMPKGVHPRVTQPSVRPGA